MYPHSLGTQLSNISSFFFFFFFLIDFIHFLKFYLFLFLAVLGLHCGTQAFSSCGERGLLFIAVCGLLIAVASLVKHGLSSCGSQALEHRLSSCGTQA